MTNRTITARRATYGGRIGTTQFVDGTATVDDATAPGKAVIEFAKRAGWTVSGGINTAPDEAFLDGAPIAEMTTAEMKTYLDGWNVEYPSGASDTDLRNAILTAYETRAQGGSAALPTAGHTQGTFPVEGAPNVPGDDEAKAAGWHTPITGAASDVLPTFSAQPANVTVTAPATATFNSTVSGTPTPKRQWQRQAKGAGAWTDIQGATNASYTTPATSVATNAGDKYRVIATNSDGSVTSAVATLTVN